MKQHRWRFFCGVGAVIFPMAVVWLGHSVTDQDFQRLPLVAEVALTFFGMVCVIAAIACFIVGMYDFDLDTTQKSKQEGSKRPG